MLQQTQVATVIPYFERFLARFPTLEALAAASLEDVLRMWAGLGYYARARCLHQAARIVMRDHAGCMPREANALRSLPGVGPYTAGAIASIAFGRRAAVVDGNVARVLARLRAVQTPVDRPATRARLWKIAESLLPRRGCGSFNQALMELGATVCTPKSPDCPDCPVAGWCAARRRNLVAQIPRKSAGRAPRAARYVVAAVHAAGRFLFETRPAGGLWGGLWQLPSAEAAADDDGARVADALIRHRRVRGAVVPRRPAVQLRWPLTHRDVAFDVFVCPRAGAGRLADSPSRRWLPLERAGEVPLSAAMHEIVRRIGGLGIA